MNDSIKIFVIILLILFLNLSAQQLHIKNYTTDNGLPSSQVWCSLQDSKGYIWFGTSNGLVKYNGKRFFTYKVSDGLVSSVVLALLEENGNIWIATDNGISCYNGKSFTNHISSNDLNFGIVWCISKFQGCLWFGTKRQGLFKFDPAGTEGNVFTNYSEKEGLHLASVFSLAADDNHLWIANAHTGLFRYDGKNFLDYTKSFNLENKTLTNLLIVDATLLVGTAKNGLFELDLNRLPDRMAKSKKVANYFPTDYIYYLAAKKENLFLGTRGSGLIHYKDRPIRYTTANGLINNFIYSILIDKENSVWITTNSGISKIISHKFTKYLDNMSVLSACEYKGAIWLGTFGNGLIRIKGDKITTYNQNGFFNPSHIWALGVFDNKLWIGGMSGLYSYDGNKFKKYRRKNGIAEEGVLSILPTVKSLWVATVNKVYKFEPHKLKNKFLTYGSEDGLTNTYFQTICQDGNKIWVGSPGGAFCLDPKEGGGFKKFSKKDGLSSNCINVIFKDNKGILWFGTPNGLNKYEPDKEKKFNVYTIENGLSDNHIVSIIQKGKYLWLGTSNGLNKFDGEKVIKIFTQKSGLIGNESSSPNAMFLDSNNHIWIGSPKGVTKYIPENDIPNKVPPPVYIENFFMNNSLIGDEQDLEFEYKKNAVKFSYIGLSFKNEDDVQYKYKLEGYDKEWSEVTEKTEIRYTNLNNGTYTFMVLARNGDGFWSKTPAEISFKILPPFWKSWWFVIIVSLMLIGIIYGVFLLKTTQMRNRAKKLEQKIDERTKVLKDSEEKYRTLIEHSNDMIWTLDEKGNFVYFNKKSEEITGHQIEEGIGGSFALIILKEDLEKVKKVFIETMQGKSQHYEVRIYDSKRRILFLSVNTAPILKNGKVIGTISFGRDITKQKKMEEELLKASKLESLGILAGGIAHDFNNTLTAIIGNLSLAKLQVDSRDKLNNTLMKIEKSSQQARDLTQQLLTFARGGTPIKKKIFVNDLLKDSASFALRGSNVRCKFLISDDTWPVEVDEGQISQVINNLTMNADQAMPAGGVLNISAENISIDKEESLPIKKGNYVKITIKDIGAGIPDDCIQKIFDPYFTTKQEGSGLGLTITYSIIKKHNGYITVKSKPGVGTTFFVYLPASEDKEPSKEKKKKIPLQVGEGKVLVMDDEESVRDIAGEMLKHISYTVELAEDGKEALELFMKAKDSGAPFEVVILDLTVAGGMGGKETIKELIKIDPKAKVIVSSGYSDDPVLSNFRKYGFSGVVSKPYTIQELSIVLHKVYQKKSI
jgi:PAS domain S-box-containing protein